MPSLEIFRNIHKNAGMLVCGCGPSLNELHLPINLPSIGVNDVSRLFTPCYLVALDAPERYGERFQYIQHSQAKFVFSQLELPLSASTLVQFRLGEYGGVDFTTNDVLHHTQNSGYVALQLACYMGATNIGLIGVDFTDGHFFGSTGRHPLAEYLPSINQEFGHLYEFALQHGIEIVNLSEASRVTAFPKVGMDSFLSRLRVQTTRIGVASD